jgi:hypothetical protein
VRGRLFLCIFLGLPSFVVAQKHEASWDSLRQLRIGEKIQVVDMKLKSAEGEFLRFSGETISLKRGNDDLLLQRTDVLRVSARGGGRLTNSLVGGTVGLLIGTVCGAVIDALDDVDRSDSGANSGKVGGAVAGFGIGAGVGAIFPGYHTVYRSATPQH